MKYSFSTLRQHQLTDDPGEDLSRHVLRPAGAQPDLLVVVEHVVAGVQLGHLVKGRSVLGARWRRAHTVRGARQPGRPESAGEVCHGGNCRVSHLKPVLKTS